VVHVVMPVEAAYVPVWQLVYPTAPLATATPFPEAVVANVPFGTRAQAVLPVVET